jgi:hypothetical protein
LASVGWVLVATLCVLTYSLRRHKADDYRGRYRVWLWAAAAALWLSMDATAGLRQLAGAALAHAIGSSGPHWWLVLYAPVLLALVVWLALDLRHCRVSTALAATASVGYLVAAVASFGWLDAAMPIEAIGVLQVCTVLAAQVFVAVAVLAFVRHVVLDVQGLLPEPKPAKVKSKPVDNDSETQKSSKQAVGDTTKQSSDSSTATAAETADDDEHAGYRSAGGRYLDYDELDEEPRPARARRKPKRNKSQRQFRIDDEEDEPNPSHLSKTDRKRLRKQKMLQREVGLG